jgi:hypothetical protein
MPRKNVTSIHPQCDPTLPTSVVTVEGVEYKLCLDFGALIDSEEELIAAGHDVSLMFALNAQTASSLRIFFAIAMQRFHPDIPFEAAKKLFVLSAMNSVQVAVLKLYEMSMPQPEQGGGQELPGPTQSAG